MGKGEAGGTFNEEQLTMYKECFKLMDIDKDGVINKSDLRASFDNVGRLMADSELDEMLAEIGGTCNYDSMIRCFENKMAGGCNDADEAIIDAIKCHNEDVTETVKGVTTSRRLINAEEFKHALMAFGDKLTQEEVDDIFDEFDCDDEGYIETKSVVDLFVAGGLEAEDDAKRRAEEQEKKAEEKANKGAEADASADAGGDGGKKKKKKKKAAK